MAKQVRPKQQRKRRRTVFAFYSNSLPLLYKSNTNLRLYLVAVLHRGSVWYRLEIETSGTAERGALTTFRKNVRLWQSLNRAVGFVRKTLPELNQVTLTLLPLPAPIKKSTRKGGK